MAIKAFHSIPIHWQHLKAFQAKIASNLSYELSIKSLNKQLAIILFFPFVLQMLNISTNDTGDIYENPMTGVHIGPIDSRFRAAGF